MDAPNRSETSDILRSAWKRFAELDATAIKLTRQHHNLRKWIAILGVIATLLAVVVEQLFRSDTNSSLAFAAESLRIVLIMLPITISVLAAYINKFLGNGEWLTLRAAAEELLKEIYLYRTVLQGNPDRAHWLSHRMISIMRRVYKSMSGQLVLESYNGPLPPYYNPNDPDSDPGFCDLDGSEYLRFRLINQRNWHRDRIMQRQNERKRIQLTILAMGGFGALLAALAGPWIAWVAVTAAIASALTGWEQLRGLDETIMIYSRVTLELTIVRDEWESTARECRSREDFIGLVRDSEGIMWAQSQKYVATMLDVLAASEGDDARLVENMIRSGRNPMDVIQDRMEANTTNVLAASQAQVAETIQSEIDEVGEEIESALETGITHFEEDTLFKEVDEVVGAVADAAQAIAEESGISEETVERPAEDPTGGADLMKEMMSAAEAAPPFEDEVFPEDQPENTTEEEFPEAITANGSPDRTDEEFQQAIEEVFHPEGDNSMIEEALSGFMMESAEDEEIKG